MQPTPLRGASELRVVRQGQIGGVSADPDDDLGILTAIRGEAELICTLDRHLWHPEVRAYCSQRGIRVVGDVELLEMLCEAD